MLQSTGHQEGPQRLLENTEFYRADISRKIDRKARAAAGQFMTPAVIARFMASQFENIPKSIRLLDPGAGVGALSAAFVEEVLKHGRSVTKVHIDAFEIEVEMLEYLRLTLDACEQACARKSVEFSSHVFEEDFIKTGCEELRREEGLFSKPLGRYTHCIMNPPYKKIHSNSEHRAWLKRINIETSNLYTGFLAVAIRLLTQGGELVAIVPRSFCNGVYFRPFRKLLLSEMALKKIHVFDARNKTFAEDEVLQENIIFHGVRAAKQDNLIITSSNDQSLEGLTHREVPFEKVVKPNDSERIIHVGVSEFDQMVVDRMSVFAHDLNDLGLEVSTGPVVDFRLKEDVRSEPKAGAFPLIYPGHFKTNFVQWPNLNSKKSNAIFDSVRSRKFLMPNGWYVLVRRFSAKEESRRIVGAIHDPGRVPGSKVGFENHLNVFHLRKDGGLDPLVAKGLAIYVNSTLLDMSFRQFSGHTQVNAADLRMLRYPSLEVLKRLGENVGISFPTQDEVDKMVEREIGKTAQGGQNNLNPLEVNQKIKESLSILEALDLPRGQRNERSALTLLALLELKPGSPWKTAKGPLIGITPIMDFVKEHYGKQYAPNTRETFRRQTMHQFVDAGIAVPNPDRPDRPINSPKWIYQIETDALELLRVFGSQEWPVKLSEYNQKRKPLAERYAKERKMGMIPVIIEGKKTIELTPGAHSQLIKAIIEQFAPRFAPGARVLYLGDTGSKMAHFDRSIFKQLGLAFDSHGKFPDVVLYYREKNWLLLIESVTSHGPVDPKRHSELCSLFSSSKANLIFVTAFPKRQTMSKYLADISWETEVWIADSPSHLIHFNGEKFLGPYEQG